MDKIRKDVFAMFKSEWLSVTIDTKLIEKNFLDVSFNLELNKFFPFRKPTNFPLYIHSRLNYPPFINKQLSDDQHTYLNSTRQNHSTNQLLKTVGLITL